MYLPRVRVQLGLDRRGRLFASQLGRHRLAAASRRMLRLQPLLIFHKKKELINNKELINKTQSAFTVGVPSSRHQAGWSR
jgi:hypothetical protein